MDDPDVTEHEVSFEEALAIAIDLLKHGQLAGAGQIFGGLAEMAPHHPGVLHYSGVLAHRQGRSDEAIALIEESLARCPDQADGYSNLGIIFKSCGRLEEAAAAYERAIALEPRHANAYNNLGVLRRAMGRPADAETAYRKAIEINPAYPDAYHNLGVLLSGLRRMQEAVICYCKAITLSPHNPEARRLLGLAYSIMGQRAKALEVYEEWLTGEPGHPLAMHLRAACTGEQVPPRASDACVQAIFDTFAMSFDATLAGLQYRAPALVAGILEEAGLPPTGAYDVLDAGCGTGLCGPLVRPYARRLTGVDLSSGMLAEAEKRQVYDDLVKGELTQFLSERPAAFDVIVSADTLVYFGRLEEVAGAAAAALRRGGLFAFTLEELVDGEPAVEFRLEHHGRYAHPRGYVARVLEATGLGCEIGHAELRMESGVPVAGLVVRARKPPAPQGGRHESG